MRKARSVLWDETVSVQFGRQLADPYGLTVEPAACHRITLAVDGQLACDCGQTFASAVELELHQQRVSG